MSTKVSNSTLNRQKRLTKLTQGPVITPSGSSRMIIRQCALWHVSEEQIRVGWILIFVDACVCRFAPHCRRARYYGMGFRR